jgi:hypothetical protein
MSARAAAQGSIMRGAQAQAGAAMLQGVKQARSCVGHRLKLGAAMLWFGRRSTVTCNELPRHSRSFVRAATASSIMGRM